MEMIITKKKKKKKYSEEINGILVVIPSGLKPAGFIFNTSRNAVAGLKASKRGPPSGGLCFLVP